MSTELTSRFEAMMRISAKAEYACLAAIELAKSGTNGFPKRVREIAGAQGIPGPFLIQILLRLKAAGLVQSVRGAVGGYRLARRPSEISVGEVIAVIDGRCSPLRKVESIAARNLAELFFRVTSAEQAILSSATIAQLAGMVEPHHSIG
jgi:Rrf2 family protein